MQHNESFKSLAENIPDTIIVTDDQGIIQICNSKITQLFGYAPEELIGKEVEILIPGSLRAIHKTHVQEYFKNPQNRKMGAHRKVLGLRKDKTQFEVDIILAPLIYKSKTYTVASCRDITEIKEREGVLEEEVSHLDSINKELERYNYTISHDLKSPLAKIEGLLGILLDEIEKKHATNEVKEISGYIKDSVHSMGDMIDSVLDNARKGHLEEVHEQFSVDEVMRELHKLVTIPGNFNIQLNCDFEFFPGKKIELVQVLLNLLSNSIKYNNKEQGLISMTCKDLGEYYKFSFSDNGPGIPPDKIQTIFNLFEKGEEPLHGSSHGVGLFTVKNIIESKGCKIWVKNNPGQGVTFEFTWPKSIKTNS